MGTPVVILSFEFLKYIRNFHIFYSEPTHFRCSLCKCSVIIRFVMKYLPHIGPLIVINVFSTWIITKVEV